MSRYPPLPLEAARLPIPYENHAMTSLIALPTLSPMPATRHPLGPADAYEAHVRASIGNRGLVTLLSDADEVLSETLPAILCPRRAGYRAPDLTSARVTCPVVAGD